MLEERVLAVVKRCVAESLAVPVGEIATESRLVDDLGADSLDFVDIVFMLDRELDIRVRETEFNFLTRLDFSSPDVMTGEHLTPAVVDRLLGAHDDLDRLAVRPADQLGVGAGHDRARAGAGAALRTVDARAWRQAAEVERAVFLDRHVQLPCVLRRSRVAGEYLDVKPVSSLHLT